MLKPISHLAFVAVLAGCATRFPHRTETGLDTAIHQLKDAGSKTADRQRRAALYLASASEASRLLDSPSLHESARRTSRDAITGLVTLLRSSEEGRWWNRPLAFSDGKTTYHLRYAAGGRDGIWDPDYFTSFTRADQIALKNLHPNRREGVGAALAGFRKTKPPERQVPSLSGVTAPVTALLDFKGSNATLTLVNPTEKTRMSIAGAVRPLEADFSAPLAAYPRSSELWNGVMGALRVDAHLRDCGIRFPQHLLETTSAFATLALLQANISFVALVSIEVAQFFAHQQMSCILPLELASRSEPYELVTRKGAQMSPAAKLLFDELVHRRS